MSEADDSLDREGDIGGSAATGEVGNGEIETLKDGASDRVAGKAFKSFIEEITGVEVGGDEDIGAASNGGTRELFCGDGRVDGSVELHFAVNEDTRVSKSGFGILHEINRGVVATATVGGEGKESNARFVGEDFLSGEIGLEDNFLELLDVRMFAGGHVGEEIGRAARFFHDGEARKSVISSWDGGDKAGRWAHAQVFVTGENNFARRIINASNQGVGFSRSDKGTSGS